MRIVSESKIWPSRAKHRKLGIETKIAKHPIAPAGEFFSVNPYLGRIEAGCDKGLDDLVFGELSDEAGHPTRVVNGHLPKCFSVFDGLVVDDPEAAATGSHRCGEEFSLGGF